MSDDARSDPGLHLERTDLAWRRTLMGLAIGAVVALRVLPATLGGWSIPLALAGLLVAVGLWISAIRRTRHVGRVLLDPSDHLPGAGLLLLLALTIAGGAVLGLIFAALPG